jgi:hypothetical protein
MNLRRGIFVILFCLGTIVLQFLTKDQSGTSIKFSWYSFSASCTLVALTSLFTWWQIKIDKTKEQLELEFKKISDELVIAKSKIEKIDFGIGSSYDDQFKPIFKQMKLDPNREISILNYTQTGFPDNYANHFTNVIIKIIQTNRRDFISKPEFIAHGLFIDWKNIFDETKRILNNGPINIGQFKRHLGINNDELETIVNEVLNGQTLSPFRDKYLLFETYFLITENIGDKVIRMYYLNPENNYKHLENRLLFACSTLINCLLSNRYKLAIIPARIKNPYSDNITSYQVLHGLSATTQTLTPQSWVFSGIKTSDIAEDKLDYVFMQCRENRDAIIGTKGIHTLGYLKSIWKELEENNLVLFDGTTLYLKRICELAYLISLKSLEKPRFKEKIDVFIREVYEISGFLNLNLDVNCNLSLNVNISGNSIWHLEDINNFNRFLSQDKSGCNSFINCGKLCTE